MDESGPGAVPLGEGETDSVVLSLLRRIEAGDGEALESLIARYQDFVLRFFLRAGCAYHDARDLTQETFVGTLQSLGSYDPHRSPFETWLYGICRNRLLVWKRSAARRSAHFEKLVEIRGGDLERGVPRGLGGRGSESGKLLEYVHRLPPKYRETMHLVIRNFSTAEIAARLRISLAGARRRIRIAFRKIRSLYERDTRGEQDAR